ncbi:MAG: DUF4123 domain-containing protein [Planctomycetes bacterium]|nr:DUF4123 domain-containing protein [Planctomycetota bacterium]
MTPRAVEVQLRDGDRFSGLLVVESEELIALEVCGRLLELRRRDVVSLRFVDHDPTWTEGREGGDGPTRITRQALEGSGGTALRGALGPHGLLVVLPSRAPKTWAKLVEAASGEREGPPPGPFPLWDGEPGLPLERVPHLLALRDEPSHDALLAELGPLDAIFLESRAAPLQVARFLGNLRWVHTEEGRLLGLRFYDPRVLVDLWEHLDSAALGLLFGSVWTRWPTGQEELLCPLCDGEVLGLSRTCPSCGAGFLGEEAAPYLLAAYSVLDEGDLVRVEPWPPSPALGRGVPTRPLQRGRKALRLPREAISRLGRSFRARFGAPR